MFVPLLAVALTLVQTAPPTPPPPAASPSPAASAQPAQPYGYVVKPAPAPSGAPIIEEIAVSDRVLHTNAPFSLRVLTSPDVTSVAASAYGQTIPFARADAGRFFFGGTMPSIPSGYTQRDYNVGIIATTADGRTTRSTIRIRLEP